MSLRAVAVTILSGLALLPFATGRGATAAEPSLVELLTSAGEYVLAYEDAFRVVVAEEVYVQRLRASPSGPVQRDAPPELGRGLRARPGTALPWWLLRDVYEVDGAGGARPAGPSREAPGREPGRRPRAGAGDRRRGRPLQPRPQRPELQRADPRARLPPPVPAAPLLVREEGNDHDRGALVRRDRLPRARGPHGHPRPRLAAGRARRGSGLDPRREGRHGGAHRARPGPAPGTASGPARPSPRSTGPTGRSPSGSRSRCATASRPSSSGARGRSGSVEFVEGLAAYSGFRQAGVSTQEEFRRARARRSRSPTLRG